VKFTVVYFRFVVITGDNDGELGVEVGALPFSYKNVLFVR